MKRWRRLFRCFALAACLAACLSAAGCGVQEGDKKGHDVALTIWHVYGGQTDSPFNAVIDEYNQTAGKEEGIYVQVASVTNTNTIHEDVLAAANGDPGAAELPDMFVSYPKTVLAMPDDGILLNYEEYFDEEARKAFLPEFCLIWRSAIPPGRMSRHRKSRETAKPSLPMIIILTISRWARKLSGKISSQGIPLPSERPGNSSGGHTPERL